MSLLKKFSRGQAIKNNASVRKILGPDFELVKWRLKVHNQVVVPLEVGHAFLMINYRPSRGNDHISLAFDFCAIFRRENDI